MDSLPRAATLLLLLRVAVAFAADAGPCGTHDWFRFTQQPQYKQASLLCRGSVDASFDRRQSALKLLRQVIRQKPQSTSAFDAHEQLMFLSFRAGEYREALKEADAMVAFDPHTDGLADFRSLLAGLSEAPDLTVERAKSRIVGAHAKREGFYLQVAVQGQKALYIADTGANVSLMSEAEAHALRLRIRRVSATTTDIAGTATKIELTTVDHLRIGNLQLEHVAFLVVPETQPPFNELPVEEQALLGLPVLRGLKALHMNSQGQLSAGAGPEAGTHAPFAYDGSSMVIPIDFEGRAAEYTVDTGAEHSTLNPPFAKMFPETLASGEKKEHTLTGVGGSTKQSAVELKQLRLSLAGTDVVLSPATVLLKETSLTSQWAAGNLGADLLRQTAPFTLDFQQMELIVER